jgi:hypothetical protein
MNFKKASIVPTAAAVTLLAAFGVASAADQTPENDNNRNATTQQVDCGPSDMVDDFLAQSFGDVATGIKGSDGFWDMEIYADINDGSWTIVATSDDPSLPDGMSCLIGGADYGYPELVEAQPWYDELKFGK